MSSSASQPSPAQLLGSPEGRGSDVTTPSSAVVGNWLKLMVQIVPSFPQPRRSPKSGRWTRWAQPLLGVNRTPAEVFVLIDLITCPVERLRKLTRALLSMAAALPPLSRQVVARTTGCWTGSTPASFGPGTMAIEVPPCVSQVGSTDTLSTVVATVGVIVQSASPTAACAAGGGVAPTSAKRKLIAVPPRRTPPLFMGYLHLSQDQGRDHASIGANARLFDLPLSSINTRNKDICGTFLPFGKQ